MADSIATREPNANKELDRISCDLVLLIGGVTPRVKYRSRLSLEFVFVFVAFGSASAWSQVCGDANSSGTVNIADVTYTFAYLFQGGPPPVDFLLSDVDTHSGLNSGDMDYWACFAFCDPFIPQCPPSAPAHTTTLDSQLVLRHPNLIPAGLTSVPIPLFLDQSATPLDYRNASAFSLVAQLTADGQQVRIDSALFPVPESEYSSWIGAATVDTASATVVLGYWSLFDCCAQDTLAIVYISLPGAVGYVDLSLRLSAASPLQAPTPDSSLFTMFRENFGWRHPTVEGHCCLVPGDADFSGSVTIADVTYGLARIFSGGPPPICPSSADANADGGYNIGDQILVINYIFGVGPAPVCGP